MGNLTILRYVGLQVIFGVLITMSVVLVMIFLVDFVELSRDLDSHNVSAIRVAGLSMLRAPALAEATLPFMFLFGVMWAMYRLNRRSELIVMRAAGMSAWRFIAPAAAIAVLSGVLMITVISPAATRMMEEYELQKTRIEQRGAEGIRVNEQKIWLRERRSDGQIAISARASDPAASVLYGVSMYRYEFDDEGLPQFLNRLEADEAQLNAEAGFWQLTNVREYAPEEATVVRERMAIPTDISPSALAPSDSAAQTLTVWELRREIDQLQENGFDSRDHELRWHGLLALPVTLTAMTLVAAAACLRLNRRGGTVQLVILAALVGFAMFFGDRVLTTFGATQLLPLLLAAWTAPLFTIFAALFVISAIEEG